MALASPVVSRPLYEGDISVYRHVVPGLYLAMTLNHSGGLALRWFRDGFCEPDVLRAARDGVDAYDLMLPDAPRRSHRPPRPAPLRGLRHADLRHRLQGGHPGADLRHHPRDLATAILEG